MQRSFQCDFCSDEIDVVIIGCSQSILRAITGNLDVLGGEMLEDEPYFAVGDSEAWP